MDALLIKLTAVAYLIAAGSFFLYLFRGAAATRVPTVLLLFGFVVHSLGVTILFFREGFATVAVMGDALLFNSWLMVGVYLLIQLRYRLTVLGGIIAPLAFLMTFAASAVGGGGEGQFSVMPETPASRTCGWAAGRGTNSNWVSVLSGSSVGDGRLATRKFSN